MIDVDEFSFSRVDQKTTKEREEEEGEEEDKPSRIAVSTSCWTPLTTKYRKVNKKTLFLIVPRSPLSRGDVDVVFRSASLCVRVLECDQ